ncbi:hypothetical protein SUGI_0898800 [Cryptomeria japonica]|nr:hypothetical protein SUGI_0898800 [Cryptomeria japonica]
MLLAVDEEIIENDSYLYARIKIVAVKKVPSFIYLKVGERRWKQQVEVEHPSPCHERSIFKDQAAEDWFGFGKSVKKWIQKEGVHKSVTKIISLEQEIQQKPASPRLSKCVGTLGECSGTNRSVEKGVDNNPQLKESPPQKKGCSDTEIEYNGDSDEDFLQADVLDNLDQRCISQSANILLGFFQEARGSAGGLGVLWNPHNIKVMELERIDYWLFGVVHSLKENMVFPLVNVYGPIKIEEKAKVWKDISIKIGFLNNDRVIVVGDFNSLLDLEEKRGGLKMTKKFMEDFRDFMTLNHLFDVIPKNGRYTWTNRRENFARISERLDKFQVDPFWLDSTINLDSCIFSFIFVKSFLVRLSFHEANKISRGSFRFQGMWWREKDFLPNVESWWKDSDIFSGTLSYCFVKMLCCLQNLIPFNIPRII